MTTETKNRPIETIRALGGLKATIWGNAFDNGGIRYSVELSRTYMGKDDKLHDTGYFTAGEVLQVARLAEVAYDRINELANATRSLTGSGQ